MHDSQQTIPSREQRLARKLRVAQPTLGDLPAFQMLERAGASDDPSDELQERAEKRATIRQQIAVLQKRVLKAWRLATREPDAETVLRCQSITRSVGAEIDEALRMLEYKFGVAIRGEQTEQRIVRRHKLMVGVCHYYRLRGLVDHADFVFRRMHRKAVAKDRRTGNTEAKKVATVDKKHDFDNATLARAVAVSDAAKRVLSIEYRQRIKTEADKTTSLMNVPSCGLPSLVDIVHENRQLKIAIRELLAASLPVLTVASTASADESDETVSAKGLRAFRDQFDTVKARLDGSSGMLRLLVDYRPVR